MITLVWGTQQRKKITVISRNKNISKFNAASRRLEIATFHVLP